MKGRATLILFGALLLLAAFVYFFEIKGKAAREKEEAKSKKLLSIDEDQIQKLTVRRPSENLVFEKDSVLWRILEPVKAQGDKYAVKNLVSSAATAKSDREIADPGGLSEYGLAAPKATLIVQSKTGQSDTLLVGDPNPTGSSVFVKKPRESEVHLTGTSLSTALSKSLFDLRDRTALPFEKDDVRKIEIRRGTGTILLEKEKDSWELKSPVLAKAGQSAVDGLLNKVSYAEVKKFVEESPSALGRYGLTAPSVTLTLTGGANQSQKRLLIGGTEGAFYYAKDEARPPVFTVDSSLVNEMKKGADELRDKKVCEFDQWNVQRCEIRTKGAGVFSCSKDTTDNWTVESPEKGKAKSSQITGMFSDLSGLEAKTFIGKTASGLSRYGLDRPVKEVMLKDGKGGILASVAFGNVAGRGEVFVLNRLTGWAYSVQDGILSNLSPVLADVLEKEEPAKPESEKPVSKNNASGNQGDKAKK
jgi:hypothetical protein